MSEEDRPPFAMTRASEKPEWQQVIDLFAKYGLPPPEWRLRDELVTWLAWARYGEKLDEQLSHSA